MARRQVTPADVGRVSPAGASAGGSGRPCCAQRLVGGFLLAVFMDVDRTPAEVVTVYRTSKVDKYRS